MFSGSNKSCLVCLFVCLCNITAGFDGVSTVLVYWWEVPDGGDAVICYFYYSHVQLDIWSYIEVISQGNGPHF